MSKSKKNYPDPLLIVDKYGADALRYYLTTSGVMKAQDLCFSEKGVEEVYKKIILITLNVLNFYLMYAKEEKFDDSDNAKDVVVAQENVMDNWILAKLNETIKEVTEKMDAYDLPRSVTLIGNFINELSTWYVRRSRNRVKSSEKAERQAALKTLEVVLENLAKIMAPFTPFIADHLWQKLGRENSVHLQDWPDFDESKINKVLLEKMKQARQIVELALATRDEVKIKVRQPLAELIYQTKKLDYEFEKMIAEEINVLKVSNVERIILMENWQIKEIADLKISLNLEISETLRAAGDLRELVRQVNNLRKTIGLTIGDRVKVYWQTTSHRLETVFNDKKLSTQLQSDVLAEELINEKIDLPTANQKEFTINGEIIWLGLLL
jgi:isoleucyl-tRNA synthetase